MSAPGSIAAMGQGLGPDVLDACRRAYDAEQGELMRAVPLAAGDLPYGPAERQVLDVYAPRRASGPAPVIAFFHGGGFIRGDKGGADRWHNASVGRMAAQAGMMGVVANYRLAPDHPFPAGAEDVAGVVDWLRANAREHGGDPDHIMLVGTSAGAVHVAGYLKLRAQTAEQEIAGAVLLSGLYGYTPLERADFDYYGPQEGYAARAPRGALVATKVPLLVACSQYDPPRFQSEFLSLMRDRLERHGTMPESFIGTGHNHYSLAMHLGTSDRRLADAIADFTKRCSRSQP